MRDAIESSGGILAVDDSKNGGVFLSYASQDADAAAQICKRLRDAGIDVWFDRNELRGGDAWDQRIRSQVQSCALFIPIISRNTQECLEGYFRREWKLAAGRTNDMADEKAFLLPIVIDETTDREASVPERFRDVQWTRLIAGDLSPKFVEHVARILSVRGAGERPNERPTITDPVLRKPRTWRSSPRRWIVSGAIVAAAGLIGWIMPHMFLRPAKVVPYSIEDRRMTFAVLPFHGPLNDSKGLRVSAATTEAITATLEQRKTLWARVASRSSVQQTVTGFTRPRELARALDVHFLILGTVLATKSGYTAAVSVVDADSERTLETQSLSIVADALTPRWQDDTDDALGTLLYAALKDEVKKAANKPVDALDVRDLSFRAYVYWGAHSGAEAKEAYHTSTELLHRALDQSPDDLLALFLTAKINLCDCVKAWSQNIEEQRAIGAAAVDKFLSIDPSSKPVLAFKAIIFQLRGRYEESVAIADVILQREPENNAVIETKADGLLHLGRAREALPLVDSLLARNDDDATYLALGAAVHYALTDYKVAAQLAKNAATQMSEEQLRSPVDGPVVLTLAAAEAQLGHNDRAKTALADFHAALPQVATIADIKKWIYPTADLYGYEPLFDGLRLAGVKD